MRKTTMTERQIYPEYWLGDYVTSKVCNEPTFRGIVIGVHIRPGNVYAYSVS